MAVSVSLSRLTMDPPEPAPVVSVASAGASSGFSNGGSVSSSGRGGRTGSVSLLWPPVNTLSLTGSGEGHAHGQ